MTTLLIMSACGLLALGLYHLSCAIVDVPTPKTSKMMLLAKKQTGIGKENLFDVYLTKIAERFSPLLKLDPIKRGKLALTLSIAGIYLSPETYTLKALFTSLIVAALSLPLFLSSPLFGFLILGLAVLMWFSTYYKAFDLVKKRKKLIEAERPRFCISIGQSIATDRDVLKLLSLTDG